MSGKNRRRSNSRSPKRNKLRKNTDHSNPVAKTRNKKDQKTKSKQKQIRKKPREAHVVNNVRKYYADKLKDDVALKPDSMREKTKAFRILRPGDKQKISRDHLVINNPKIISSETLEAFNWTENGIPKIIIKDLGRISEENFGVTDTIHAIIQKANTNEENVGELQIYLNTNSTDEMNELRDELSITDPDLFQKIIFVRNFESDRANNNNNAPVQRVKPVMDSKQLIESMGENPKFNLLLFKRSEKYKDVIKGLDNYHSQIDEFSREIEKVGDNLGLYNKHKNEIDELINDLNKKIDLYISESNSQDSSAKKDLKKEAMEVLQDALFNIQRSNTNADMDRVKEKFWLKTYKPLTDDQIDNKAQEIVLGKGAQGVVKTVTFKGDPPFVAALKIDSPEKSNMPSRDAGIEKATHEQGKRAVASFTINNMLKMKVIPETKLVVRTNKDNGKIEFGQAMQMVNGIIGQRTIKETQVPPKEVESWGMDPADMELSPNQEYYPNTENPNELGELWNVRREAPNNVDLSKSVIQRDLSELQILDNIIGHADRHGENFIFVTAPNSDEVTGVMGIDNDDTFGNNWHDSLNPDELNKSSKTPGLPPVIDINTAMKLLNLDPYKAFGDMKKELRTSLSQDDIDASIKRLFKVQSDLKTKIGNGTIKVATTSDLVLDSQLKSMESAIGNELAEPLKNKILKWGPQTMNLHTDANSYLGITKKAQPEN